MSTDAEQAPAEEVQDKPDVEATEAPPSGTSAEPQTPTDNTPDYFGDKFDPTSLEDKPELLAAYKLMQGQFTRKNQEVSERLQQAESVKNALSDLRSEDPEIKQGALSWLTDAGLLTEEMIADAFGWEIETDTPTEDIDPSDPAAIARAEIEAFKAEQAAKEKAAEEKAWVESEDKRIKAEFDELGVSERDRELIFANALYAAQKGLTEGIDIKRAHEEFEAAFTERQKAWRDGKSTAQPTAAGGEAATQVRDLDNMTESERHEWMRQRARELAGEAGPGA